MPERGRIARLWQPLAPTLTQVLQNLIGADTLERDTFVFEPLTEPGRQPNLSL